MIVKTKMARIMERRLVVDVIVIVVLVKCDLGYRIIPGFVYTISLLGKSGA